MITLDITLGDSIELLKRWPSSFADLVFVDPPYNTKNDEDKTAKYDRNKDLASKNWKNFKSDWDDIPDYLGWCTRWLYEIQRILKPRGTAFVCGSFHNIGEILVGARTNVEMHVIQKIAWCIPNAMPNLACTQMVNANQDLVWLRRNQAARHFYDKVAAKRLNGGKNLRDFWLINNDGQAAGRYREFGEHESKKPVALIERALEIAVPKVDGMVIVDFFAGSGTTAEAAHNVSERYGLHWQVKLIERDPKYAGLLLARGQVLKGNSVGRTINPRGNPRRAVATRQQDLTRAKGAA